MGETEGGRQMKKSRGAHVSAAKSSSHSKSSSAELSEDGKEETNKASWDDELERHLVHSFIAISDKYPNADGGLKSQQWTAVLVLFNKSGGVSFG